MNLLGVTQQSYSTCHGRALISDHGHIHAFVEVGITIHTIAHTSTHELLFSFDSELFSRNTHCQDESSRAIYLPVFRNHGEAISLAFRFDDILFYEYRSKVLSLLGAGLQQFLTGHDFFKAAEIGHMGPV